ncbi:hypothetical protein ACF1AO_30490 [Streptomyces longwoodensis]|uniref:hypothetical protein n=1 Tax=Streptomyces longwoodensis TaxID=68231 RepID=UPI0036FC02E0
MTMRRALLLVVAGVASVGLLTACGGGGKDASPKPSLTISAGPVGDGGSTAAPSAGSATAQEVLARLSAKVSAAKPGTVVTAENDKNKLLGRPHQYTSKQTFTDSRIATSDTEGLDKDDSLRGGAVEVFGSADDAKARSEYIQSVTKSMPMLAEYHYLDGPVLVRVSHFLTPQQAGEYGAALRG